MQRYLEKDPLDDRGITLEELVRNYIGVETEAVNTTEAEAYELYCDAFEESE